MATAAKAPLNTVEEPDAPFSNSRVILLRSARKEDVMEYSLVLASQGIKHWIEVDVETPGAVVFSLSLDEADAPAARQMVDLYRQENRGFHDAPGPARTLDLFLSPLLYLAVPTFFYFWIGLHPWANWWHRRGSADAGLILHGEWWRCITATVLHAGHEHFLSNLVSGYFILNLLNHRMGMGTIMAAATLGAAATNYLVALTSASNHVSVGFSSVVFCTLGMLAAAETLHLPRREERRDLRRLTPLVAAFFVAVMVGLGQNADVKAHFYGFAIGAALGFALGKGPRALARRWVQAALVLATYGLYALAWNLAAAS